MIAMSAAPFLSRLAHLTWHVVAAIEPRRTFMELALTRPARHGG